MDSGNRQYICIEVDLAERSMILSTGEVRLEDILDLQGCVFDLLEAS